MGHCGAHNGRHAGILCGPTLETVIGPTEKKKKTLGEKEQEDLGSQGGWGVGHHLGLKVRPKAEMGGCAGTMQGAGLGRQRWKERRCMGGGGGKLAVRTKHRKIGDRKMGSE